jgi:translation initiation factor RLI1
MFWVRQYINLGRDLTTNESILELNHIMDRDVNLLSGGELQRFAIGTVCVQQADVYATFSES